MKTVVSIFTVKDQAGEAIDRLKDSGFDPKDISVIAKDARDVGSDKGVNTVGGAVSGATTGAILGGLAGLAASYVIPGLGAFFIGGPIAAALGLTGVAAATASGAATGAVAGGILGALMGFGLTEEEARGYEERINQGGILVAVPALIGDEMEIEELLTASGAEDVKTFSSGADKFESRVTDDRTGERTQKPGFRQGVYAYAGAKGGKSRSKSRASTGKGRGWHGDSEDHSIAGKGRDVPGRGKGK